MIKTKHYILLLLGLGILISCGEEVVSELAPASYVRWVKEEDHGLRVAKQIKELEFTAQYKPLDFIVAQEQRSETLEKELLETRKAELGTDYLYYNFRIKNIEGNLSPLGAGANSDQIYQQRLGYFTFDAQQDLYLLHGQDTLPCSLFQFVRNYDIAPYIEFALGFKKSGAITEDITFVFEDKVLGIGKTQLLFKEAIFKDLPKIKTL